MRGRSRAVALLSLSLLLGVGASAGGADEETVAAVLAWEPTGMGSLSALPLKWVETPPEGAMVPADGIELRYATRTVGDGARLFLAVETGPEAKRVWLDHDFDNDLTNGTAQSWKQSGSRKTVDWVVSVPSELERDDLSARVQLIRPGEAAPNGAQLAVYAHRPGTVVLGNRVRLVALADRDHDLRFVSEKDALYLDLDGNGTLDRSTGSFEELELGKPFRLGDEGWTPRIATEIGSAVEFVRTKPVPPAKPRQWKKLGTPTAGSTPSKPTETLDELVERFKAEEDLEYSKRYGTVNLLGRTGEEEAAKLLLRVAEDGGEDLNLRAAAVRALGYRPYLDSAGKAVKELADDAQANVASAAIQALYGMAHPDCERIFRNAIGGSNATVVGQALRYLAYIGPDDIESVLREAYREASQDALRYQAYNALRYLEDGPGEKILLDAAESTYASLCAQALGDLHQLNHPDTRKRALAALDDGSNLTIARRVVPILASYGDKDAIAAILELAATGHSTLAPDLSKALSPLRGGEAVDALIAGLKHSEPAVRGLAAEVLAANVEKRATAALLKQVKREKDPDAASRMLEALGDHGNPDAVSILLKAAKNRDELVRASAIRALARIGLGIDKVRTFFLSLLDAKRWEDRILATDAAAASGHVSMAPRIRANLDHERWEVRLTVAEALRKVRERESVEPLVVQLEKETEARVAAAIGQTLFELTGMQLYSEAAVWRRWFDDHGDTFEMPEAIPVAKAVDGGTSAGFYGIPIESRRVIFVIDQSGSMSAADSGTGGEGESRNRLEAAVEEVKQALGHLPTGTRVNVYFFHTTHRGWKDRLTKLTKGSRKNLISHLEKQNPTGGTNIYDPLEAALTDDHVDTILLLSDGVPGSGKYVATEDILRGVRRLNQTRRIAIHCVSLGMDSALLKRLAAENGGRYVRR